MPQYNARVIAGLALLALAFTGAEAVVCSANQYLEMDGAKDGATPNAPKCTACPSTMTAPAGVAGGYADSAAPRYAAAVALAVADGSANNNLLTWCNVPAGSWLSTEATATAPGAVTACGTTTTTSAGTTISGALAVQTAASHCVTKSACAANEYLESNGAKDGATPNALICTACPSTMTAPAGTVLTNVAALRAKTAVADGSANTNLITWCNVPAGSWLSTEATATVPGAVTACGTTTSTSPATTITGALSAQTAAAQCSKISSCAADKYLESNGAKDGATPNALICTACPTGMTAPAGTTLSSTHASAAATAIADGSANTNLITWCNVPEGSWLSTEATATAPGAVSSCGDVYQTTTSPATTITGALSAQTAIARCTLLSRCAAGEYLESDGGYQAAATGLLAVSNKLVCTTCPTGMTSYAGATYGALSGAATAAAATAANTNLFTFCNVPNNYWLSTESTTTTPGAITACGGTYGTSDGTLVTGALGAQTELATCGVPAVAGATGAAGAAGAAGAPGAAGTGGAIGSAGPAGPAGPAGVSPAAPLSTTAATLIGIVLPVLATLA